MLVTVPVGDVGGGAESGLARIEPPKEIAAIAKIIHLWRRLAEQDDGLVLTQAIGRPRDIVLRVAVAGRGRDITVFDVQVEGGRDVRHRLLGCERQAVRKIRMANAVVKKSVPVKIVRNKAKK